MWSLLPVAASIRSERCRLDDQRGCGADNAASTRLVDCHRRSFEQRNHSTSPTDPTRVTERCIRFQFTRLARSTLLLSVDGFILRRRPWTEFRASNDKSISATHALYRTVTSLHVNAGYKGSRKNDLTDAFLVVQCLNILGILVLIIHKDPIVSQLKKTRYELPMANTICGSLNHVISRLQSSFRIPWPYKKLIRRWDTRTWHWHRSILLPFLRLTPPTEGFPCGTISANFCTEVKGWPRYKMAKKYCRKFQHPE